MQSQEPLKTQSAWRDAARLVASLIVLVVALVPTFYTLFTLPVLLVAGVYLVYVIPHIRARRGTSRKAHGYLSREEPMDE